MFKPAILYLLDEGGFLKKNRIFNVLGETILQFHTFSDNARVFMPIKINILKI